MCMHSYSLSSTYVGLCIMTAAPSLLGDLGHVLSPVWASLSSRFWEELASVSDHRPFWDARTGQGLVEELGA